MLFRSRINGSTFGVLFSFERSCGALAQLGERLLCTQEVSGSIPLGSIESKDSKDCPLKIEYLYQIPRFKKLNCR